MCEEAFNELFDRFSSSSSDCPDKFPPHENDQIYLFEFNAPDAARSSCFTIHRFNDANPGTNVLDIGDIRTMYPYATVTLIDRNVTRTLACDSAVDEILTIASDGDGDKAWRFCDCDACYEWLLGSSSSSSFDSSSSSSSSSSEGYSSSSSSGGGVGGGDPAPKTCATLGGVTDPPDLILKVTGGTGTITFAGETWTEGQRGEERRVCPTVYQADADTGAGFRYKRQNWGVGGSGLLNIDRHAYGSTASSFIGRHHIHLFTGTKYIKDYRKGSGGAFNNIYDYDQIGVAGDNVAFTTYSDWYINTIAGTPTTGSDMMGSFTDAGGVVYTWRRGDKWTDVTT
jgi:hypothetical protein